ncbi:MULTISPECIES: hypothetical protein [unclassified Bradyrhizobium]|uniref:hypothetical protein n=1 Tax=unclassified Bradyrhizobium TaxID=2631580 RepID=UPI00048B821A|nr:MULTISPECIES: hypothetical protein [unclassified Bradyrhizobium]QIG95892.1 hypothetical protein G6P99_28135 [Bradyrhizobium sp. 6(2017)]
MGAKLRRGSGADHELSEILTELSTLSANKIVRASREITQAAGFAWWWQHPSLTDRLFRFPQSERQLMFRNADYAWLFLFHPDGYLREAALCAIATPPTSSFFLSALAWRLNDWAGPVRRAAIECFRRVSANTSAAIAAEAALYLLERRFV